MKWSTVALATVIFSQNAVLSFSSRVAHQSGRSLRRLFASKKVKEPRFDTLQECEAAYETLWNECKAGQESHPVTTEPDRDAEATPADYQPPETRTGKPNKDDGWDYKKHGEDWVNMGQCKGPNQSPVDVSRYIDIQGQTKYLLWFDYFQDPDLMPDHKAALTNDGHGVRFDIRASHVDFGYVKIGKTEYEASEYIFHAPSEHTVDGAVFPLEMQIYNEAHDKDGIVAIAIFFREGESNPFIASLMEGTGGELGSWSMGGSSSTSISGKFSGAFDLENVIPMADVQREASFYNYEGSLTQPPCTTGVDWWVLSKPISASRDEIRFIRKSIYMSESSRHGNARETQPLGNRRLFVGLTGFQHAIKGAVNLPGWKEKDRVQEPRGFSSQDMPWGEHWAGPGPGPAPAPAPAL